MSFIKGLRGFAKYPIETLGRWNFGADGASYDVYFYGDAAGSYMYWDASAYTLKFVGEASINVGATEDGVDVFLYGDTSGAYVQWDASDDRLEFVGGASISIAACTTGILINSTSTIEAMTLGTYSSTAVGSLIAASGKYQFSLLCDDNGVGTGPGVSIIAGRSRLLTTGAILNGEQYGWHSQVKVVGGAISGYAAGMMSDFYWGGTTTMTNGVASSYIGRLAGSNTAITVSSGFVLSGFCALMYMTGDVQGSGGTAGFTTYLASTANWDYGILLPDGTTDIGISIGACTTGITLDGAMTDGIIISGACGDNGIEISGTCTEAGIDIQGTQTAAGLLISGTAATGIDLAGTFSKAIRLGTTTVPIEFTAASTEVFDLNADYASASSVLKVIAAQCRLTTAGVGSMTCIRGWSAVDTVEQSGADAFSMITGVQGTAQVGASGTLDNDNLWVSGVIGQIRTLTGAVLTSCKYMAAFTVINQLSVKPTSGDVIGLYMPACDTLHNDYGILMDAVSFDEGIKMTGHDSTTIGLNIAGGTFTTAGIVIAATCTTGIDVGDDCTTGIDIGTCTTGISIAAPISSTSTYRTDRTGTSLTSAQFGVKAILTSASGTMSAGGMIAVRGETKLSTSITTANSTYGVSGQITTGAGTIALNSNAYCAGVHAAINATSGSLYNSTGHVACLACVIAGMDSGTSTTVNGIYIEQTASGIMHSFIEMYGRSTYVFSFPDSYAMATTGTVTITDGGWLKCYVNGEVRYIPLGSV